MTEANVVNHSRKIKDPTWVTVERFLKNRLDELNANPDKRPEYELSLQRYHGLTSDDVIIEPVNIISPTKRLVSIVTRKTGFARVDLEITRTPFVEITDTMKIPYQAYDSYLDILEQFRATTENALCYDYVQNCFYGLIKGDDPSADIKELLDGVYFDKVIYTSLDIPEGTIPADYISAEVTLTDDSLENGTFTFKVLNHKDADGWIARRVLGLRPTDSHQVVIPEGILTDEGVKITFFLEGYHPDFHEVPEIFYGNTIDDRDLEVFKWPADTVWKDGMVHCTFSALYTPKLLTAQFRFSFRMRAAMKDGSGMAESNSTLMLAFCTLNPNRFIVKNLTPQAEVSYSPGVGFTGILYDNQLKKEGHADPVFDQVQGHFKTLTRFEDKELYVSADTMLSGNTYEITYTNNQRLFKTSATVNIPDELLIENHAPSYQSGFIVDDYKIKFKLAGPVSPTTIEATAIDGVYQNAIWSEPNPPAKHLKIQLIPIPVDGFKDCKWDVVATSDTAYGQFTTEVLHTTYRVSGEESSMEWIPTKDPEMDWDNGYVVIEGKPVDKDGNVIPGPFEFLPPIINGDNIDPDRPIIVETNPDGSFTVKVPTIVDENEGGHVGGDITVIGSDGKTTTVPIDENFGPKVVFDLTEIAVEWSVDAVLGPIATLRYRVVWPEGATPIQVGIFSPLVSATHTVDGGLTLSQQHFDIATGQGRASIPIVKDLYREMTYVFQGFVGAGKVKKAQTWNLVIPATGGFYINKIEAVLSGDAFHVKYQGFADDNVTHPTGLEVMMSKMAVIGQPVNNTFSQLYDRPSGVIDITVPVTRKPNNTFDGIYDFALQVADNRAYIYGSEWIVANNILLTVRSTVQEADWLVSEIYAEDEITRNPKTGNAQAWKLTVNHPRPGSVIVTEKGAGVYEVRIPVAVDPNDVYEYQASVEIGWMTPGQVLVTAPMVVSYSENLPWPSGGNGKTKLLTANSKVTPTDIMISGVNRKGDLVAVFEVRLPDNTIPRLAKFKRPLSNVSYLVGSDLNPKTEVWDPVAGTITVTYDVYTPMTDDRSYTVAGDIEFYGYTDGKHPVYTVGSIDLPKWGTVGVAQTKGEINANRTKVVFEYTATDPTTGLAPNDFVMKRPFNNASPTGGVYDPVDVSYDPATGKGGFSFPYAGNENNTVNFGCNTDFSAYHLNSLKSKVFSATVGPSELFKCTYQKSKMAGNDMTVTYKLVNPAGQFPTTATMGDLTTAVGTLDGTKTPYAETYDPLTGIFTYSIKIINPGNNSSVRYQLGGTITVNTGATFPIMLDIPPYDFAIRNVSMGQDGANFRVTHEVKRVSTGALVTTGRYENVVNNRSNGSPMWFSQDTAKTVWYCYSPSIALETETATRYTVSGNFIVITAEGLEFTLPWTASYTVYLSNNGYNPSAYIDRMTWTNGVISVFVRVRFGNGVIPKGVTLKTPLDFAVGTPGGTKMPDSNRYDQAAGEIIFTFNQAGTVGEERYMSFEGWCLFPEYGVSDMTKFTGNRNLVYA